MIEADDGVDDADGGVPHGGRFGELREAEGASLGSVELQGLRGIT